MFRSIAKRKKDEDNQRNIVHFNEEEYLNELTSFVKQAFSVLPETDTYEETEEKKD